MCVSFEDDLTVAGKATRPAGAGVKLTTLGCARHLLEACRDDRPVQTDLADPSVWARAVEAMIAVGQEDAVLHAAPTLQAMAPDFEGLTRRLTTARAAGKSRDARDEAVRRLRLAHAQSALIDTQGVTPDQWAMAVEFELASGIAGAALDALPVLRAAFPRVLYFRALEALDRRASAIPPRALDDQSDAFLRFAPAADSDALIVVFATGERFTTGAPGPILHRLLSATGAHLLYVREPHAGGVIDGAPGLGETVEEAAASIRALADDLGARRLVMIGAGGAGYSALRYGLECEADAVLAYAAQTRFTEKMRRGLRTRAHIDDATFDDLDLAPRYDAAAHPPRLQLVHSVQDAAARRHALHLANLDGVTVEAVDVGPHLFLAALLTGRFEAQLERLLA